MWRAHLRGTDGASTGAPRALLVPGLAAATADLPPRLRLVRALRQTETESTAEPTTAAGAYLGQAAVPLHY